MKKLLILIFAMILVVPGQAQKTDLTLNLEKGKEYKHISNSRITRIEKINGQEIKVIMNINDGITYKVVSVNTDDYDLEAKYESLSMTFDLPQDTMGIGSEINEAQDFFSTLLSEMIGYVFNVKMSKKGKIIEVKNIDSRIDSIVENNSQIPETQLAQQKAQMNEMFSADAFQGNMEMVTAIFPDKPVSKGDKWTKKSKLETGMSAVITTEYEFIELGPDYASIMGNSVIETADNDGYTESNGMFITYDLSGSMISEIKVDKETGWIIEAKINQDIKGDAYVKLDAQMSDAITIPMNMIMETLITDD